MGRYDKYNPKVGGYRAPLAADWPAGDVEKVIGVGHNSTGAVVKGAGTSGLTGVIVLTMARKAGDIVDVMTSGEIVEFGPSDAGKVPGVDFGVAGTVYYSDANGLITSTAAEGSIRVGHTVEGQRLIVRLEPAPNFSLVPDGTITTDMLADGAVTVPKIGATGTPADGTYLEGDGTWSAPA